MGRTGMNHNGGYLGDPPEEADTKRLAQFCSLCGLGYHPDLEIDIGDESKDGECKWAHTVCLDDHAILFTEEFGDQNFEDIDSGTGGAQ